MDIGWKLTGKAAFIAGVFIAGFMSVGSVFNPSLSTNFSLLVILAVLGVVIGIVNISQQEFVGFLIAIVALVSMNFVTVDVFAGTRVLELFNALVPQLGNILVDFVDKIIILMVPVALIVGFKTIWKFASIK